MQHVRNAAIRFKLSLQKETGMDEINNLHDQAERAERLSMCITDTLTVERLKSFAAECRRRIALLTAVAPKAA